MFTCTVGPGDRTSKWWWECDDFPYADVRKNSVWWPTEVDRLATAVPLDWRKTFGFVLQSHWNKNTCPYSSSRKSAQGWAWFGGNLSHKFERRSTPPHIWMAKKWFLKKLTPSVSHQSESNHRKRHCPWSTESPTPVWAKAATADQSTRKHVAKWLLTNGAIMTDVPRPVRQKTSTQNVRFLSSVSQPSRSNTTAWLSNLVKKSAQGRGRRGRLVDEEHADKKTIETLAGHKSRLKSERKNVSSRTRATRVTVDGAPMREEWQQKNLICEPQWGKNEPKSVQTICQLFSEAKFESVFCSTRARPCPDNAQCWLTSIEKEGGGGQKWNDFLIDLTGWQVAPGSVSLECKQKLTKSSNESFRDDVKAHPGVAIEAISKILIRRLIVRRPSSWAQKTSANNAIKSLRQIRVEEWFGSKWQKNGPTFCANEMKRRWNFFLRTLERCDFLSVWCDKFHFPNICRTVGASFLRLWTLPCRSKNESRN